VAGLPEAAPSLLAADGAERDRREQRDRRRRVWWSLVYGSFNPRRRRAPRRVEDATRLSAAGHTLRSHAANG